MDNRFNKSSISIKANPQPTKQDWLFSEQVKTNKVSHIFGMQPLIEMLVQEDMSSYTLREIKTLWFFNCRPVFTIHEFTSFPNGMGASLSNKLRSRAQKDNIIEIYKNNGNGLSRLYKTTAMFKRRMNKWVSFWTLQKKIPINKQVLGKLYDDQQIVRLCLYQHEAVATKDKDAVYNAVEW